MLSTMVWLYLVLVGLIRSQVSEGCDALAALVDARPGSPLLSPIIARSSAYPDIRSVHLHSDAPEAPVEIQVSRGISHAVDSAQLRSDVLEDAFQILDAVGMVEPPAGSIGERLQLLTRNFS